MDFKISCCWLHAKYGAFPAYQLQVLSATPARMQSTLSCRDHNAATYQWHGSGIRFGTCASLISHARTRAGFLAMAGGTSEGCPIASQDRHHHGKIWFLVDQSFCPSASSHGYEKANVCHFRSHVWCGMGQTNTNARPFTDMGQTRVLECALLAVADHFNHIALHYRLMSGGFGACDVCLSNHIMTWQVLRTHF